MSTNRRATVERKTSETQIQLTVALDGSGVRKIATPVPFFNHMLEAFAKHAKIIHIDVDPSEINKNKEAHIPICSDVKYALAEINKIVEPPGWNPSEWTATCTACLSSAIDGQASRRFQCCVSSPQLPSTRAPCCSA